MLLDLIELADEWQETLNEMMGNVPNTEGMSWGEVHAATESFLADPEQADVLAKYTDLCGELGIDPEPDALRQWAKSYTSTLIPDDEFEDHAREIAADLHGDIGDWPLSYIDWERAADALRQDYTSVVYDDEDYLHRS